MLCIMRILLLACQPWPLPLRCLLVFLMLDSLRQTHVQLDSSYIIVCICINQTEESILLHICQNATCVIIFVLFLIHELQGQLNMNFAACYLTSEHFLLVQFNVFLPSNLSKVIYRACHQSFKYHVIHDPVFHQCGLMNRIMKRCLQICA